MNFDNFKDLHLKYSNINKKIVDWKEYEQYCLEIHQNSDFYNYTVKLKLNESSFNENTFCCFHMADKIISGYNEEGKFNDDDPDNPIFRSRRGEYTITIFDGSGAGYSIEFCPWCGKKLKPFYS